MNIAQRKAVQEVSECFGNDFDAAFIELEALAKAGHLADPQKDLDCLARFIMDNVPGEPSQSEGVVDTAIRIIKALLTRVRRGRCSWCYQLFDCSNGSEALYAHVRDCQYSNTVLERNVLREQVAQLKAASKL